MRIKQLGFLTVLACLAANVGLATQASSQAPPQQPEVRPALIEQPMMDFTLPAYQGGEVTLSKLKGKNVMIIFPRGWAGVDYWCTICNYRYAELLKLEQTKGVRKAHDMEVLVVLPYDAATVKTWVESLGDQLKKIKDTKNPADSSKLDDAGKRRMERWRQLFPEDFTFEGGKIPTYFPVLIDADRKVSKTLDLFRTEWTGSKVDQNIPSVFIVDKNGILKFKYMGQNTLDRPSYEYIFSILDLINSNGL